jgi:hypothetical protein
MWTTRDLSDRNQRQWLLRGGWVNLAANELAMGGDHRDLAFKALKATNRLDQIIEQLKQAIPDFQHPEVEYVRDPDEDDDELPSRRRRPARSGNGRARAHKGNKGKATAATQATGTSHG